MTGVDDEGPEIRLKVRLETSNPIRANFRDLFDRINILLRLGVFVVIASGIIGIGLIHNGLDWFHAQAKSRLDGFH